MVQVLSLVSYLIAIITGIALLTLAVGLVLAARPELGASFGLDLTSRDGLAVALASGAVAIASALAGRALSLLRDNASA